MPKLIKLLSMPKNFFRILFWLAVIAVFWLSVLRVPRIRVSEHWFWDNIDKIGHGLAYLLLQVLVQFAYSPQEKNKRIKNALIWAVILFAYSWFLELIQWYLPHRSFDPFDLIANLCGIVLGLFLYQFYSQKPSITK